MPVTYKLDSEAGFIETHGIGDVTFDEVIAHFRELESDPSLPRRLDVLLDLDQMTSLPTSVQLQNVSQAVDRLKAKVEWGACAIVASDDALFGMSRVFEVFTERLFASATRRSAG